MKFLFGQKNSHDHNILIEAKNVEMAVKIFKVKVLFPEKYVAKKYIKESDTLVI